jgi:hypothetical protein
MIELAEVIGELQKAMHAGEDEPLRFELGPVELEATMAARPAAAEPRSVLDARVCRHRRSI